jgi:hypothetical protein
MKKGIPGLYLYKEISPQKTLYIKGRDETLTYG